MPEFNEKAATGSQLEKFLMRLSLGSRLQGFLIKVLCLLVASYLFQSVISVLQSAESVYGASRGVGILVLGHVDDLLRASEPIVWEWLVVVSVFAAFRMYRIPRRNSRRTQREPR